MKCIITGFLLVVKLVNLLTLVDAGIEGNIKIRQGVINPFLSYHNQIPSSNISDQQSDLVETRDHIRSETGALGWPLFLVHVDMAHFIRLQLPEGVPFLMKTGEENGNA